MTDLLPQAARGTKAVFLALLAISLALVSAQSRAAQNNPFLSPLFSDNMVLQRNQPVPIWGWTDPGQIVTVTLAGHKATATAGSDGRWQATLPAMKAGGPYTVSLSGPQKVTLHNVLIGDVWICSGQSNMQFGVGNLLNPDQVIAKADNPKLRLYTVGMNAALEPQATASGSWLVCTPQNIRVGSWGGFSAVAYFFGQALQKKLGIPIGLIHTSWGGTPAEAWTSAPALLQKFGSFAPALQRIAQAAVIQRSGQDFFEQAQDTWYQQNDPGTKTTPQWQSADLDESQWQTMNLPIYWENAGIPALSAFDGIMWFRKEIDLSAEDAGKAATLHLGPIDDRDTTWVNGTRVGGMNQYDQDRIYTIPAGVLKAGRNVIAVRVLDTGGNGGIWGTPDQMSLQVKGGGAVSLAGPWKWNIGTALSAVPAPPASPEGLQNEPSTLYNGMIAPLIPYGIKGAIWYQGESNADRSYQYRSLLPAMIDDWRTRWGEGSFPFLIVQLANFMATKPQPSESGWAELREAQLMTWQHVPNTGMAVIIDIGDANDIHPKDKQDVGSRLALAAGAVAYGDTRDEYSGPIYKSMTTEGNRIHLTFDHLGGGLVAKGGLLSGFAIAGADKHWVWANAIIDGDTVVVSSPEVPNPVAVRYAWADNPVCNLYNKAGLPASPFRTDDWPGVTENKQ
ncbi:MAG TPA: sialate O-acetylesterase [Capsulimonadaceae bacterium]|nr:sialate O-acetylesterase [Capsulimonadaceae bacterium]